MAGESVETDMNTWRPQVPPELQDYNWDKANVNDFLEMYSVIRFDVFSVFLFRRDPQEYWLVVVVIRDTGNGA